MKVLSPLYRRLGSYMRRSPAWIELNLVITKLHFLYDAELLSQHLDWHGDSTMATLWQKPKRRVRATVRVKDFCTLGLPQQVEIH